MLYAGKASRLPSDAVLLPGSPIEISAARAAQARGSPGVTDGASRPDRSPEEEPKQRPLSAPPGRLGPEVVGACEAGSRTAVASVAARRSVPTATVVEKGSGDELPGKAKDSGGEDRMPPSAPSLARTGAAKSVDSAGESA